MSDAVPSTRRRIARNHQRPTDWAVIDRIVAGDQQVAITSREMRIAIRRLRACGLNGRQIAQRLGINSDSVYRIMGEQ